MQRMPSAGKTSRPKALVSTKSFTRFEPEEPPVTSRPRSSTNPDSPVVQPLDQSTHEEHDVFHSRDDDEVGDQEEDIASPVTDRLFSELPTELQTLVENFLESLGAKVHPTPLSIDQLSQLFQDFYDHAGDKIQAHMDILAARSPSNQSPTPSISSASSVPAPRKTARSSVKSGRPKQSASSDHQMLTPAEIADRRKARKQLDQKRIAIEEAVERSICEKVYPRIWRHRSTDDAERDEKLRSRAAALALVGVDLRELLSTALGSDLGSASQLKLNKDDGESARARLAGARQSLQQMNDDRFPLGKLEKLKAAHKDIVEALQGIFPSTSSADEVLPTLIFTLITSDPESNHVVSNFNFVQRFRASTKIDGEAAYCLTNLEAAITFLETVDLSSLRSDEGPEGPSKLSSQPPTPRTDTPDPMYRGFSSDPTSFETHRTHKPSIASPNTDRPRGLSVLTHPRHRPFEAQSDAVMKKADEAIDTIHHALDGSFKFLFGRLRERQPTIVPQTGDALARIASPRTLEDAHKLVTSSAKNEDDISVDGSATADTAEEIVSPATQEKVDEPGTRVLQFIGGKRSPRRGSVDSSKSVDSASRKVSFADINSPTATAASTATGVTNPAPAKPLPSSLKPPPPPAVPGPLPLPSPSSIANQGAAAAMGAVEGFRNVATTLNPLRGLSNMGMMRGFGRSSSSAASTPSAATANLPSPLEEAGAAQALQTKLLTATIKDKAGSKKNSISVAGMAPPLQRFVELKDFRELSGFETELLLRDYQRLAGMLRALSEQEKDI